MKHKTLIASAAAVMALTAALSLHSCVIDGPTRQPQGDEAIPVTIGLNHATRVSADQASYFTADDYKVTSLRVLIYDSATGQLKWNFAYTPGTGTQGTDTDDYLDEDFSGGGTETVTHTQPKKLDIATGTYDFVFVANEGAHPDVADALAAMNAGEADIRDLEELVFPASAFRYPTSGEVDWKGIPMVSHYRRVRIKSTTVAGQPETNGTVTFTDPFDKTATEETTSDWNVMLRRAGVRLDIDLTVKSGQLSGFTTSGGGLSMKKLSTGSPLMERGTTSDYDKTANDGEALTATGSKAVGGDGDKLYTYSMILPERFLAPGHNDQDNALILKALGREGKVWYYDSESDRALDKKSYSLPRNMFLRLTAEIAADDIIFDNIRIVDWGDPEAIETDKTPDPRLVMAAPGMVGIRKSDYDRQWAERLRRKEAGDLKWASYLDPSIKLTIRGSSTYAASEVPEGYEFIEKIANDNFDGLEPEPVYTVYFKWGSMVAMIGGLNDELPDGDRWRPEYVVWVNPGFGSSRDFPLNVDIESSPVNENAATIADWFHYKTPMDAAKGHGDICSEITGGTWRVPSGGSGAPAWNGETQSDWKLVDNVNYGYFGEQALKKEDNTIFLPETGIRSSTAFYGMDKGYYWSSATKRNSNTDKREALYLSFGDGPNFAFSSGSPEPFNFSMAVRCVQVPPINSSHILYFDDDGTLKIGKWGEVEELTTAKYQTNMAFFKFGSVVGFNLNGSFTTDDIKFNPSTKTPTTYGSDNAADGAIPGFSSLDYDNNYGPNISSSAYHKPSYIRLGKGDPCQLIGLTGQQIKDALKIGDAAFKELLDARDPAYKGWRLPTSVENNMFVGGHPNAYMQVGSSGLTAANWLTWEPGDYNYYYTNDSPQSTTHNSREHYPYYRDSSGNWTNPSESTTDLRFGHFPVETVGDRTERSEILPATGYRGTNGTVHIQGSYGYFGNYWSSTAYYGNGYCLWFDSSFVSPSSYSNYVDGFAVRCVRP